MNIEKILNEESIDYLNQEYDEKIKIYKLNNKANLVQITGDYSTFAIDRDLNYYLNSQNMVYAFILVNKNDSKLFYLEFRDKNNWLNASFERSNKDRLYFGKVVLNNQVNLFKLRERIKKLV